MPEEMRLELDCAVCGQNAEFYTESPVQWQAFYDAWTTAHKHSAEQISEYYKASIEA